MRSWLGRGKSLQYGVTVCCLTAFILFGYDQGVFGGILQNEDWLNQFGHPSDSETGIIVSCYNLGCLAGCVSKSTTRTSICCLSAGGDHVLNTGTHLVNFFLGEKLGRRNTIWTAMVFVLIGAILQTTAFHVPHLVISRVVTGFGTGMKTSTVPM